MAPTYRLFHSGAVIDLLEPRPELITLEDIAHHLSRMCRFGGACDKPLYVAQHCVHVSLLAEIEGAPRDVVRWALLHDALEFVCDDLGSPMKRVLRESDPFETYDRVCANVSNAISVRFGVPMHDVKRWDVMSMLLERRDNGPHGLTDDGFLGLPKGGAKLFYSEHRRIRESVVVPWSINRAEYEFVTRAHELEIW